MKVEFQTESDYLAARVTGEWTSFEATGVLKEVLEELEKTSMAKLLFDLTNLLAPKSNIVRFHAGVKISEILFRYKIAGFAQPEKINRLGEISATNRGANFRMFYTREEALQWLLAE